MRAGRPSEKRHPGNVRSVLAAVSLDPPQRRSHFLDLRRPARRRRESIVDGEHDVAQRGQHPRHDGVVFRRAALPGAREDLHDCRLKASRRATVDRDTRLPIPGHLHR
jgi:hypothetical protein